MNDLEKRSFYSFLGLYILSSLLFLTLIGYWYYTAQKNACIDERYYKLQHIADMTAGEIIMAHMQHKEPHILPLEDDISVVWISKEARVVKGQLLLDAIPHKRGFFTQGGHEFFVSDAPREHLDIKYVVAQSSSLEEAIRALRNKVLTTMLLIAFILVMIAWMLAKLFMKPVRQRVAQIERFINDVTHELNTPITSLSMSSKLALKEGKCTEKMLKNISISTKQLYDIYRSLTYLNFSTKTDEVEVLDLKTILQKSVAYYTALAELKRITFDVKLESTLFQIPEAQATLLFGNLIGNAIKYSSPKSNIEIVLSESLLSIKDEGIGIEKEQQKKIFEKFERGTEYSGGFGVGLSIVKSICDTYGIEVHFDSEPKKGTVFRLTFI